MLAQGLPRVWLTIMRAPEGSPTLVDLLDQIGWLAS
jgi:hypothetical protein